MNSSNTFKHILPPPNGSNRTSPILYDTPSWHYSKYLNVFKSGPLCRSIASKKKGVLGWSLDAHVARLQKSNSATLRLSINLSPLYTSEFLMYGHCIQWGNHKCEMNYTLNKSFLFYSFWLHPQCIPPMERRLFSRGEASCIFGA